MDGFPQAGLGEGVAGLADSNCSKSEAVRPNEERDEITGVEMGCEGRAPGSAGDEMIPPPPASFEGGEARVPKFKRTPKQPTPEELRAHKTPHFPIQGLVSALRQRKSEGMPPQPPPSSNCVSN